MIPFKKSDPYDVLVGNLLDYDSALQNYNDMLTKLTTFVQEIQQNAVTMDGLYIFSRLVNNTVMNSTTKYVYNDVIQRTLEEGIFKFTIEIITGAEMIRMTRYRNIPHLGFALKEEYYTDHLNRGIFQLECPGQKYCIIKGQTACTKALYAEDPYKITEYCKFKQNRKTFDILHDGIAVYDTPTGDLKTLVDNQNFNITGYPCLIQFTGEYNLKNTGIETLFTTLKGSFALTNRILESRFSSDDLQGLKPLLFYWLYLNCFTDYPRIAGFLTISLLIMIFYYGFKVFYFVMKLKCQQRKKKKGNNKELLSHDLTEQIPLTSIQKVHSKSSSSSQEDRRRGKERTSLM
jgi:hypothetical protein